MNKHTPGPWRVVKRSNQLGLRSLHVEFYKDGNIQIPLTMPKAEEKAALIAAAPELLEAAQDIAKSCQHCNGTGKYNQPHGGHLTETECPWCLLSRRAIAKAEGNA